MHPATMLSARPGYKVWGAYELGTVPWPRHTTYRLRPHSHTAHTHGSPQDVSGANAGPSATGGEVLAERALAVAAAGAAPLGLLLRDEHAEQEGVESGSDVGSEEEGDEAGDEVRLLGPPLTPVCGTWK